MSTITRTCPTHLRRPPACRTLAGIAAALLTAACGGQDRTTADPASATSVRQSPPDPQRVPLTRILKKSELTPAEVRFGRGPTPDPSIEYRPGVIIVAGGASAIRGLSPNGLLWTIDAAAPGASAVEVGSVVFVTSRCVGRVLALRREDRNLHLLLGPVELTDVFERLELRVDDQPFDMGDVVELPTPDLPGWSSPLRTEAPVGAWRIDSLGPAAWRPDAAVRGAHGYRPAAAQTPVSPGIPQRVRVGVHDFLLKASDGISATLAVDEPDTRIHVQAQLKLQEPRFDLFLTIWRGNVYCRLYLRNTAALRAGFDAATSEAFTANYKWRVEGPAFQIPLAGASGVAVDFRQAVLAETAFSAKSSSFGARATYRLNADFGLAYDAGTWSVRGPQGISVEESVMNNMTGVSFGPTGFTIRHEVTITAGLGAAGFTIGPKFALRSSLGIAQGSSIGVVQCREAAFSMEALGGVGYTLSKPVVDFVNLFLRLVRVPPLSHYGSILATDWKPLFAPIRVQPGGQSCVPEGAA